LILKKREFYDKLERFQKEFNSFDKAFSDLSSSAREKIKNIKTNIRTCLENI
jgi:hypothetical protein